MALTVNLTKETDRKALSLNTTKEQNVVVKLDWDGNADLDIHALFASQTPNGAKVSDFAEVLSTYNVQRTVRGQTVGTLPRKADGTFEIFNGAMIHSRDVTNGALQADDEWIEIHADRFPARNNLEIPLVAMIHNVPPNNKTFADIQNAQAVVTVDGTEVLRVSLKGAEFAGYNGVQLGAFTQDASGSLVFNTAVSVFNGDFNAVLEVYS